jgi:hypothetical protein
MPILKKLRPAFNYPKTVTSVAWLATTIIFLFPISFKMTPLGNQRRHARGRLDDAQNVYAATSQELTKTDETIQEDNQRVKNLDCAMAGYDAFNQELIAFQQNVMNADISALDRLGVYWKIRFVPDKIEMSRSVDTNSWDEREYVYENYYSCIDHSCSHDDRCCYAYGYHWVTETYYYNQVTTILNEYQAIIQGTPLTPSTLGCGYYSRRFSTSIPKMYLAYESPHQISGDRRAGTVYIDYHREYASSIKCSSLLDEAIVDFEAVVLRKTDLNQAAADLAKQLLGALTTAVSVFTVTGANYPALQTSIREKIPLLLDKAALLNATLYEQGLVLAGRNDEYDHINDEFFKHLALWLSLLVGIPAGMALLTYCLVTKYKHVIDAWCEPNHDVDDYFEASMGGHFFQAPPAATSLSASASFMVEEPASPPPPYDAPIYSARFFNQTANAKKSQSRTDSFENDVPPPAYA